MTDRLSPDDVPGLIDDGDTLCIGGSGVWAVPDRLIEAVGDHFERTGTPTNISLVSASSIGTWEPGDGLDHLADPDLLAEVLAGHYGLMPEVAALAQDDLIPAYCLSQGIIAQQYREIAAGRPGLITHVGKDTFLDPRLEGGEMNAAAERGHDVVERVEVAGESLLRYEPFSPDVTFIRGTYADADGNVSMEREPNRCEMLPMAQATQNEGGTVVAQVKHVGEPGSLDPRSVVVPDVLVDYVVACPDQNQSLIDGYEPSRTGELPSSPGATIDAIDLNARKTIARRAFYEVRPDDVINLGVGVSALVPNVAAEEGLAEYLDFTIEQGIVGGIPYDKQLFGASQNPGAILTQPEQFDFYSGGGIDTTFLGFAQVDAAGNVNVSKFTGKIMGVGGFVDITQSADTIVFCGTLKAGDTDVAIGPDGPQIRSLGAHEKFVQQVEQVSYSHTIADRHDQLVRYITEVGVFELREEGVTLVELAPGLDAEADVFPHMGFEPAVASDLATMPENLYKETHMGLADSPSWSEVE